MLWKNTILPLHLFWGSLHLSTKKRLPDLKPEKHRENSPPLVQVGSFNNSLDAINKISSFTPSVPPTWRFSQQNSMAFSNPPPCHGLWFFWWFTTNFDRGGGFGWPLHENDSDPFWKNKHKTSVQCRFTTCRNTFQDPRLLESQGLGMCPKTSPNVTVFYWMKWDRKFLRSNSSNKLDWNKIRSQQ